MRSILSLKDVNHGLYFRHLSGSNKHLHFRELIYWTNEREHEFFTVGERKLNLTAPETLADLSSVMYKTSKTFRHNRNFFSSHHRHYLHRALK